jgi:glycosyltransferase involved in cell wall biosynthesis
MAVPLKVLMVNYEFPPVGGGAAGANLNILKEMAAIGGLEIDLVTSFAGSGVAVENLGNGINVHKVGIKKENLHHWRKSEVLFWMFRASGVYKKLISSNQYDLAHCFFGFPSGWFCWRHRKKMPYIISLRGSDVPGYNDTLGLEYLLLGPLFKSIWNNAASIVANSRGLARLAGEFTPALDIGIIPNGVAADEFGGQNIFKKGDNSVRILTVGRLVNRKRTDILIEAVKLLTDRGFDVSLDIAGDGVMADQLRALVDKNALTDRIDFLGAVPRHEMPGVYAKADIFVMCSEHEGMSNAMLEAMASSLPVVTSRCEGVEELITDNGFVVEPMNAENLAASLGNLIRNAELREKMSQASRQKACMLSWKEVAAAYIEKYCRIAGKR